MCVHSLKLGIRASIFDPIICLAQESFREYMYDFLRCVCVVDSVWNVSVNKNSHFCVNVDVYICYLTNIPDSL